MNQQSHRLQFWIDSTLHSYSQIFFSKNKVLAWLVVIASFVNWDLGLWGLLAVFFTNGSASLLGFDRHTTLEGLYGINSLLVIMGLALYFDVNSQFIIIFIATCLLTLFISVATLNYLARLGLPALSLPFLLSIWIMMLAIRQYSSLEWDEGAIYTLNEIFALGGAPLLNFYETMANLPIPEFIGSYFKSLAAILFQGNVLAGLLIAIGIFISSRIAFSLTFIGYLTGYLFYIFVGADITQLHYTYIGFNFILAAIALGGFFFIPNWKTYLLVIVTAPIIAMLIAAFSSLLAPFQLPVFSFPFLVIVLLVMYIMNFNTQKNYFIKTTNQQYVPEKNLYSFQNYLQRFQDTTYFQICLPYFGEWKISQGHNGKYTHKGDWRFAWDFVIEDDENNTFQSPGALPEHFYCYNLPVVAPAAGYVVEVVDDIEDNSIGDVNLKSNWGNAVIIKHGEHLYTKVCHLKEGTIQVKKGDYVEKGKLLANLGNSGRSPEPHIHFQIQTTPYVGSKTLKYPITYYLLKTKKGVEFKEFAYPEEGETIYNVKPNPLLQKVFRFIPGKELKFEVDTDGQKEIVRWEIFTNPLNQTYIYCHETQSVAYFVNDTTLQYFTSFEGDRNSLLYYLYLGTYKVLLGFYKDVKINDQIPLHQVDTGMGRYRQDILAPFKIYRKVHYQMNYVYIDDSMHSNEIHLHSTVSKTSIRKIKEKYDFNIRIKDNQINKFTVNFQGKNIVAKEIS